MDFTLNLLKELTETPGVSGYETPIRGVIRNYLEPLGELSQDKIGSVICRKVGSSEKPRIMLTDHIHSHSSIIHRNDYDNAVKLLLALINRLDEQTVSSLTE